MKTIFKEYDSKHVLQQLKGNDIFKVSNDLNFSTLINTDSYNDISEIQVQKNFSCAQKFNFSYNKDLEDFSNCVFSNIILNKCGKSITFIFDFDNEKVLINGKSYKVKNDSKFTYKFQKTQIKAYNGVFGLYSFVCLLLRKDSPLTLHFINTVLSILN